MGNLIRKGVLLLSSLLCLGYAEAVLQVDFWSLFPEGERLVILTMISIALSLLLDVSEGRVRRGLYLFVGAAAFCDHGFLCFLPLFFYDLYRDFGRRVCFLLPVFLLRDRLFLPLIFCAPAFYFSEEERQLRQLREENRRLRDDFREKLIDEDLYRRQQEMERAKDIEIAILRERNRIAREIHDAIGHTLSSAILQVEALKLSFEEPGLVPHFETLQKTLSSGMLDIRQSLHHLHSSSLALEEEMKNLAAKEPGLFVDFRFQANEDRMDYALKFAVLSVVKEALTNIRKHSDADKVKIRFIEHPVMYTLSIQDNGRGRSQREDFFHKRGLGIRSMQETAKRWKGHVNFELQDGFMIHMVLKKEAADENYHN
ncbi:MAG: histidine kinase [Peptostreptococcaceae bacterium]|nr:histidine kinase [Peptostreptococcaceae bacterium]